MTQSFLCFIALILFSPLFLDGLTLGARKHARNAEGMIVMRIFLKMLRLTFYILQDENQNMENKKSSEKISDILEEIEAVVEEEKKTSSPLGDDPIDEESQDNIENQHSESVETIEVISTINRKI